jgi:hypothetical protein
MNPGTLDPASSKSYHDILASGNFDSFTNPDSIWYWMHTHCLEQQNGFFRTLAPGRYSDFLTVGDGYCAREGAWLKRVHGFNVCATDQETCLMTLDPVLDSVDEVEMADMNNLDFPDGAFDYAFVKESLHHDPMPYRAIYEMMRVSRKGVMLIEPNGDTHQPYQFTGFEAAGNYLFAFNSSELVKVGLAMGYKYFLVNYTMVFFGFHDYDMIAAGKSDQEKQRLANLERGMEPRNKPLLVFVFLKNKAVFDSVTDPAFKKISFA